MHRYFVLKNTVSGTLLRRDCGLMVLDQVRIIRTHVVVVAVALTLNFQMKESVVTQRCSSARKIRKTIKKTTFGYLKNHETKEAHTLNEINVQTEL